MSLTSTLLHLLAVIISCLSSFTQLFSHGRTKQKPALAPTDTYYQRRKSRIRANTIKSNTTHDLSSIISVATRPLPEFDSSRGLPQEYTQYAASYDSLEMQPEGPEQIRWHQEAGQVVVIMPNPSTQRDSLAASSIGSFPDDHTGLPEENHITSYHTDNVPTQPATIYCKDHQGRS